MKRGAARAGAIARGGLIPNADPLQNSAVQWSCASNDEPAVAPSGSLLDEIVPADARRGVAYPKSPLL